MENTIWFTIGTLVGMLITKLYMKIQFGKRLEHVDKWYKIKKGTEPIKEMMKEIDESKSQLK